MKILTVSGAFAALVMVTSTHAGGMRGGMGGGKPPAPAYSFAATLSGAQNVPAVMSDGSGSFSIEFPAALDNATYTLKVDDLSADVTAVHLHCALSGANGMPALNVMVGRNITITNDDIRPIDATNPACGMAINNIASLLEAVRQHRIYVNVHTANFPAGEVRGQVIETPDAKED